MQGPWCWLALKSHSPRKKKAFNFVNGQKRVSGFPFFTFNTSPAIVRHNVQMCLCVCMSVCIRNELKSLLLWGLHYNSIKLLRKFSPFISTWNIFKQLRKLNFSHDQLSLCDLKPCWYLSSLWPRWQRKQRKWDKIKFIVDISIIFISVRSFLIEVPFLSFPCITSDCHNAQCLVDNWYKYILLFLIQIEKKCWNHKNERICQKELTIWLLKIKTCYIWEL